MSEIEAGSFAPGGRFTAVLDVEGVSRLRGCHRATSRATMNSSQSLIRCGRTVLRALVPSGQLADLRRWGRLPVSAKEQREEPVVPLHASIQEHCRKIGFDNLAPIIWHKISNAVYEVENGSSFSASRTNRTRSSRTIWRLHPDGAKVRRLPRPRCSDSSAERYPGKNHKLSFQQIWSGLTGASTRHHPAPYPVELAERLIRCSVSSVTLSTGRVVETPVLPLEHERSVTMRVSEKLAEGGPSTPGLLLSA